MTSTHAQPGAGLRIAPDDLLTLLAVARLGKYTAAAHSLGVNHTTVSRRIAALEKAVSDRVLQQSPEGWELTARGKQLLSAAEAVEAALASVTSPTAAEGRRLTGTVRIAAPEAFARTYAIPAISRLQRNHFGLQIELLTATQRASRYRSGMDIEVVVGRPDTRHSTAHYLRPYSLGLFASPAYLERHGTPVTPEDLADHRLVYYPAHSLGVDGLIDAADSLPETAGYFRSNSVTVHIQATRMGVGIGLLPVYAAEVPGDAGAGASVSQAGQTGRAGPVRHAGQAGQEALAARPAAASTSSGDVLVRVLPEFEKRMEYWASVRPEALRSPVVEHVLAALRGS